MTAKQKRTWREPNLEEDEITMKRDGSAGTHTDMWRGIPVSRNHYYKQIRQLTVYTIDKTRLLSNHYTDQIYLGPDQAGINWGLLIFFSNTNRIAVFYNYPYTTTFSSSTSQSIFPPLSSSPL
ncbi:predicted protein [Botrytis cinerea T4]|uniref:Uncharacterized protein n=1 Tax=Botryotinia fuckeliana (strain T4) TaxID=999810 RepID=G2YLA0_BOTF4|nr:predicted protein [Botrytis cinerea T4]